MKDIAKTAIFVFTYAIGGLLCIIATGLAIEVAFYGVMEVVIYFLSGEFFEINPDHFANASLFFYLVAFYVLDGITDRRNKK